MNHACNRICAADETLPAMRRAFQTDFPGTDCPTRLLERPTLDGVSVGWRLSDHLRQEYVMPRYTKQQIEEMVRVEKLTLRQELIPLQRRVRWINNRLATLEKADGLIEGIDRPVNV